MLYFDIFHNVIILLYFRIVDVPSYYLIIRMLYFAMLYYHVVVLHQHIILHIVGILYCITLFLNCHFATLYECINCQLYVYSPHILHQNML